MIASIISLLIQLIGWSNIASSTYNIFRSAHTTNQKTPASCRSRIPRPIKPVADQNQVEQDPDEEDAANPDQHDPAKEDAENPDQQGPDKEDAENQDAENPVKEDAETPNQQENEDEDEDLEIFEDALMDARPSEKPRLTVRGSRNVRLIYKNLYTPKRLRRIANPRSEMLERRKLVSYRMQLESEVRREEHMIEVVKKRIIESQAVTVQLQNKLTEIEEKKQQRILQQQLEPLPPLIPRFNRLPYRG